MFGNPRFMNGAGSTNSVDVYCFAAAQVKKAIDMTIKLRVMYSGVDVKAMRRS